MNCEKYSDHEWDSESLPTRCVKCGMSYMVAFHKEKYLHFPKVEHPPFKVVVVSREDKLRKAIERTLACAQFVEAGNWRITSDNIAILREALR